MAAKGTESKNIIFKKIMEIYPDSFWEDEGKILRVPLDEKGDRIEIKITLTAAKNNIGSNSSKPLSAFDNEPASNFMPAPATKEKSNDIEPTQEEKDNVSRLLASLGL